MALTARSEDQLRELAAALPGPSLVVPADITTPGAVDGIFDAVETTFGPVEILIANAGSSSSAPVAKVTDEQWERTLALNLTAPFQCIRRAVPAMKVAGYGRIVVIGSMLSQRGAPYTAAYAASKHGVLGLVRSAGVELVKTGVTVNAVCPAYVDTPMTDAVVEMMARTTALTLDEARTHLENVQPIGRLISVDEVVEAVRYCIANAAVTAQAVNVDGGLSQ